MDTEVTFPTTAGSALATAAASSLTNTLTTDPGQVYLASGAALLTSAAVSVTNVTQTTSLVTSVATPVAQIGPGPAPVQYLLTANLVRTVITKKKKKGKEKSVLSAVRTGASVPRSSPKHHQIGTPRSAHFLSHRAQDWMLHQDRVQAFAGCFVFDFFLDLLSAPEHCVYAHWF